MRWEDVARAEPDFAGRVKAVLDRHRHKTMATLRRDGGPRISGTELTFVGSDVWFGSMPDAMKGRDLRRDPRIAVHSASEDPPEDPGAWPGDAKLAGRAVLVTDPAELAAFWAAQGSELPPEPDTSDVFRLEPTEVVLTWIDPPETMVIESWHEGVGYRRRTRT